MDHPLLDSKALSHLDRRRRLARDSPPCARRAERDGLAMLLSHMSGSRAWMPSFCSRESLIAIAERRHKKKDAGVMRCHGVIHYTVDRSDMAERILSLPEDVLPEEWVRMWINNDRTVLLSSHEHGSQTTARNLQKENEWREAVLLTAVSIPPGLFPSAGKGFRCSEKLEVAWSRSVLSTLNK